VSDAKGKEIAFVEDIFIAQGPNIYRLREEDWKQEQWARSEDDIQIREVANLMPLIRNEVLLADVPKLGHDDGYLFINLTALAVNKD
jgi:hypothetical protein